MKQIKLFRGLSIENEVNKWLLEHDVNILDIKMCNRGTDELEIN